MPSGYRQSCPKSPYKHDHDAKLAIKMAMDLLKPKGPFPGAAC